MTSEQGEHAVKERLPATPKGSGPSARRLWRSVVSAYDLDVHEELLLIEACRTADRLDRLAAEAADNPVTVVNARGDQVPHPALTEARQQGQALARLLAALRLPDDQGHRGQRRGAPRGSYQRRAVGLHAARTDLGMTA